MAEPMTIYDALRESHALPRALCTRFVRTGAGHAAGRLDCLRELKLELAAHAAAEERFLYAPILMADAGLDIARHALSEHHEIDELIEQLEQLAADGAAWGEKAKELAHQVRHHLKEEETRFFQGSGKILRERQKTQLAARYQRDYLRMKRVLAAG